MLVIRVPGATTDTNLPILRRDRLLEGANGGVLHLADMASRFSYDGTTPTNGKLIVDIAENANGQVVLTPGETLGFSGNGIDFSPLTAASSAASGGVGSYVEAPAASLANIFGSANQYFMVCMYLKLPVLADWNASAGIVGMAGAANTVNGYVTDPELVLFAQSATSFTISVRRQTAIGAVETFALQPAAGDYGSLVQLAFWRNAGGQGARLRSANGTVLVTGAVGANNTANFSARSFKIGVLPQYSTASANVPQTANFKAHRWFIENLLTSGRAPATVLDADWTRTLARGVFS